jgi:hypothetical protein
MKGNINFSLYQVMQPTLKRKAWIDLWRVVGGNKKETAQVFAQRDDLKTMLPM